MRFLLVVVMVCLVAFFQPAGEKGPVERSISGAEQVFAVYREGRGAKFPVLIFAAWPDGHVVWSDDSVQGGVPYFEGTIDPGRFDELMRRLESDGLFELRKDTSLDSFGPGAPHTAIFVKKGAAELKMRSWHESFDQSETAVVTGNGTVIPREETTRWQALQRASAKYLLFRLAWSETRQLLTALTPNEKTPTIGALDETRSTLLKWIKKAESR